MTFKQYSSCDTIPLKSKDGPYYPHLLGSDDCLRMICPYMYNCVHCTVNRAAGQIYHKKRIATQYSPLFNLPVSIYPCVYFYLSSSPIVTVVERLYWKMPLLFAVLIAKLSSPRPSRHLGLAWFTEIRKTTL
jgi:hypothetical protein